MTNQGSDPEQWTAEAAESVFKAHYWRYTVEYFDPVDTAEEAVGLLLGGSENGDLAPIGVVFPDGHEALHGANDGEFERIAATRTADY